MTWCAVLVRVPPAEREAAAGWLVNATGQAVEERGDGVLVGCLERPSDAGPLREALLRQFGPEADLEPLAVDTIDWTERWRDGLGPRRFGRLVVAPSWIASPGPPDIVAVVLDPETAFGSGEHGSTRAALTLLERHLRPGHRVLDLGSGSGILAIAAVKLGAATATGIELDAEANPVALRNAERNGVAARARFVEGDAAALASLLGPAEIILSNILRHVNVTLLPVIHGALAPGGAAIFSGMESAEAELFRPVLAQERFTIADEATDDGWWAVLARRE